MASMMAPQQHQHVQYQQQQKPQTRPRSRGFSFKSDKSAASRHSKGEPLHESSEEKHRNHMSTTTKANPNAAITEIQPVAAALERPTIAPLRSITHNDATGNPIAEPDLSNPTRSRWERPLDTIRSFDNDIDREWRRRTHMVRPESYVEGGASTRSSYYGGYDQNQNRYSQYSNAPGGGYYNGRNRDSYADSSLALPMAGPSRNKFAQRQQSDPMLSRYNGNNGVYPNGGYQQSRDTVGTGESSASEQWNQSTNPSSENSSIDKINSGAEHWSSGGPVQQPSTIHENHAYPDGNGYPRPMNNGTNTSMPNGNGQNYSGGYQNGHQNSYQNGYQNGRPPVPPHESLPPMRAPIKLNSNAAEQQPLNGAERKGTMRRKNLPSSPTEKRKSWFKRRFSKEE